MYSYRDLVINSSREANPEHWLSKNHDFDQYNISVDLAGELTALEAKAYTDMFSFHSDLMVLFNRLKDAHTIYQAPFAPLRVYLPLWFATKMVSPSQRQIAVVSEVNGRLANLHDMMYGATPGGLFRLEGQEIAMINGKPAMQYMMVRLKGFLCRNINLSPSWGALIEHSVS